MNIYAKRMSSLLVACMFLILIVLTGCGSNNNTATVDQATDETEYVSDFEFFYRNIQPRNYVAPAESFAGGTGTENDPYQISNVAELAYLSQQCNLGDTKVSKEYCSAHYILTDDIIINERINEENWLEKSPEYAWYPIADGTYGHEFTGVFDGGGHTVSGAFVNEERTEKDDTSIAYGLFGKNNGTIKNLKLDKSVVWVSGTADKVGALIGNNIKVNDIEGKVENCTVNAEVYGYNANMGGVAGYNNGTVSDCSFDGIVKILKEEQTNSAIGGIVGYNSGTIRSCTNNSDDISTLGGSIDAGGIAGTAHDGSISECVNNSSVKGSKRVGGIVGNIYVSSVGGEYKSQGVEVKNCINKGAVLNSQEGIGGIVGDVALDNSEYLIRIVDCENDFDLSNDTDGVGRDVGGIVGHMSVSGKSFDTSSITISGCKNTANLSGNNVGGIIASTFLSKSGFEVSDCQNSGAVTAENYGSGIIAFFQIHTSDNAINTTITKCGNTGSITTDSLGGGIIGIMTMPETTKAGDKFSFTIDDCTNNADLICNNNNAFIGGIAGSIDAPDSEVSVINCAAEGKITFTDVGVDSEMKNIKKEERMELSRMGGGIAGRLGSGMYLTTQKENRDASAVNNPDAKIVFSDCNSKMVFDAPDESKYTYTEDNEPIFKNIFGGIIGDFAGEEGTDFLVKNCIYSNVDRGLGNEELPDIGMRK